MRRKAAKSGSELDELGKVAVLNELNCAQVDAGVHVISIAMEYRIIGAGGCFEGLKMLQ